MVFIQRHFLYILIFSSLSLEASRRSDQANRQPEYSTIRLKSQQALMFCKAKKYNIDFCILVDLGRHSGLNRFFIWDFKRDTILRSYLVSHGCGTMPWGWAWSKEKAVLSNADGSHCSSEGRYRIGKRGYSNWGIHVNYKLHGLDKTNSNAYARQIVLHSWEKVPDREIYPKGTPEGWGCPAVSNNAMRLIDSKLKVSKKPVLLWVFN
jgi:hypothetical protein